MPGRPTRGMATPRSPAATPELLGSRFGSGRASGVAAHLARRRRSRDGVRGLEAAEDLPHLPVLGDVALAGRVEALGERVDVVHLVNEIRAPPRRRLGSAP